MADVTEAPTQDEIAESLLPQQEEQVEQPETEQPAEPIEEAQPEEQQAEQQVEEVPEDWLPSEQDKVFPDETYSQYAQRRYPDLVSALSDENIAEPTRIALRQVLHDKINSDIYIQQQQQQAELEPVEEAQPETQPPQTQPQISREQYFQNLDRVIAERTDPEVAKSFHREFMSVWQRPEAEQPMAFAQVASKYMLNLVQTFAPDILGAILPQQVSQAFPGFSDMYERSAHAMAWDRVRNSNPQFAVLPAYGTKEFSQKLRDAADKIPEIAEMIDEAQGKPMNQAQVSRWYTALARIASGQNVDPQTLQRAAAAGAQNARRAAVRRSAGNLGSGQSQAASGNTKTGSSRFQTNADIFDDEAMDMVQQLHGKL